MYISIAVDITNILCWKFSSIALFICLFVYLFID